MLHDKASSCGYLLGRKWFDVLGYQLEVFRQSNAVLKVIFRLIVMVGISMLNC